MEKGSIIQIELTGRELTTGKAFETTDEKVAREAGFFREGMRHGPVTVVVGAGNLIKGVDEALLGMGVGEKRRVEMPPEKAFGERRKELVSVVPLREFRNRQIRPAPGLVVEINGNFGRVQTVSGGRVRVDFNSELAGKSVVYEIRVVGEFKTLGEKIGALVDKYFGIALPEAKPKWKIEGSALEVALPANAPREVAVLKNAFARVVSANLPEIGKVRYVEEFEGSGKGSKGSVAAQADETAEK